MSTTTIIVLAVVDVLVLWVVFAYNRLITLTNRAKEASSVVHLPP